MIAGIDLKKVTTMDSSDCLGQDCNQGLSHVSRDFEGQNVSEPIMDVPDEVSQESLLRWAWVFGLGSLDFDSRALEFPGLKHPG